MGALAGVLSAAVALGVGELVAAFVRPAAAPVIAVGNRVVALTPEPVKRWAIRTFQAGDKTVLFLGIYVVVAALAALVGLLALRRFAYGVAGIAAFAGFGCYCALTADAGRGRDVIPVLVGAVAAGVVLWALTGDVRPEEPARRRFLVGSVAAAGVAAFAGFGGRALQHARFGVAAERSRITLPPPSSPAPPPPGNPDLGKSGVPWRTPNGAFYRIDTALSVPQLSANAWSLQIHGMVDRPMTLTWNDVVTRPLVERWVTLCCVSNEVGGNLIGNATFRGVLLADLLREAGIHRDADELLLTSVDGMTIGAPAAVVLDGRDALLAVGMNGAPLPIEHGYPARVVVPGLYGYVSACKWVIDIEATTFAKRQAYWIEGGWANRTDIVLESRIDRPRTNGVVAVGRPVAIAGVAWDQHVGVSAVEVQVGDGPWQRARLAPVPSADTWRQWVLAWTPPAKGTYRLRVRATDATGQVQTQQVAMPFPSGATGWHTITVRAQ